MGDHHYRFLIVGGGVAGLTAAARLAELGEKPLLIEAGVYPSHRVCGEFFSPECFPILESWGLLPNKIIRHSRFVVGKDTFEFKLPHEVRGQSHYIFDDQLLQYARALGAEVLTGVRVTAIQPGYQLTLSSGDSITCDDLIVGTGRALALLVPQKPPQPLFTGYKAHFEGLELGDFFEMHLHPGAYFGISPISQNQVNVACLASKGTEFSHKDLDLLLEARGARRLFPEWLQVDVPAFGRRPLPPWPRFYAVGDAAASIHPASGDGLAMGVTSGYLAANCAVNADASAYRRAWRQTYGARLRWARLLHTFMQRPPLAKWVLRLTNSYPALVAQLFWRVRR